MGRKTQRVSRSALAPASLRGRLYFQTAIMEEGSPRGTQICLHPTRERREGKHRSRLISALFSFIGLQIDRRGGGGEKKREKKLSMQAAP